MERFVPRLLGSAGGGLRDLRHGPLDLRFRRDLALPLGVLIVQLAGAALLAAHHGLPHQPGVADWVLLVVGPLSLAWRRVYPVAVLWVTFAATLSPAASRPAYLSLIVAFFVAATGGHRRAAWVVTAAGFIASIWLAPLAYGRSPASLEVALLLLGWLAVLVIAAEATRIARERTAQKAVAARLETRRRASEERLRMARELHDVIGHNISLINLQASVGLDLIEIRPDQARDALSAIKVVSKEALSELRSLLESLRQAGDDAPRSPAPGLAHLPELIEATRSSGLSVTTEVQGIKRPLPAAVDLAAYRIIQESVTNVTRHAGPARVTIRLCYTSDSLQVEILDDGRPLANRSSGSGSGTGIAGMRERALALGGRLEAGRRTGAGFAVTAELPIREPA